MALYAVNPHGIVVRMEYLVVEVVIKLQDVVLIIRVILVDILEQLYLVQALIQVVLVILHNHTFSSTSIWQSPAGSLQFLYFHTIRCNSGSHRHE
jgi:hypothetical protein